jgi:transcriptional regulator with XRE-family HTH domain
MEDLRDALANHLRIARELAGLSPEEASERGGGEPSASYIRRLEKGANAPTVEAVAQLCAAYGTTLAKFFGSLSHSGCRGPKDDDRRTRGCAN